jgi:thiol-disulfide isomerase/thioredoxin
MFLIGGGLILLGFAAWYLLLGGEIGSVKVQAPSAAAGASAIPAKVDLPIPDLRLKDLHGDPVSLMDFSGKVILVNNWATWCPPCKAEMPTLEAYYKDHKDQAFVIVAVEAGNTPENVAKFVQEYQLSFPVWPDPLTLALGVFHNDALPSSYVIDRLHTIRLAWSGAISRENLEQYVTPLVLEK